MPEPKAEKKRREVKFSDIKIRKDGNMTIPRGTTATIPKGEHITHEGDLRVRGILAGEGNLNVKGTMDISEAEDIVTLGTVTAGNLIDGEGEVIIKEHNIPGDVEGPTLLMKVVDKVIETEGQERAPLPELHPHPVDHDKHDGSHVDCVECQTIRDEYAGFQEKAQAECDHDEGRAWLPAPTAPDEEPYVHCPRCGAIKEERLEIVLYKDGDEWCALLGPDIQTGLSAFASNPKQALMFLAEHMRGDLQERWAATLGAKFNPGALGKFQPNQIGDLIDYALIQALMRNATTTDGYERALEDIADAKGWIEILDAKVALVEKRVRMGWQGERPKG